MKKAAITLVLSLLGSFVLSAQQPITDADLKAVEAPKAELRAKGDPDGVADGHGGRRRRERSPRRV